MRKPLTLPLLIVIASLVLAITGCGNDDDGGTGEAPGEARQAEQAPGSAADDARVLWRAPQDPLERTVAAGLEPERKEFLIHHVHAHLDVFVDGEPIAVPAGIGINIDDPEVQRFKDPDGSVGYGGIKRCRKPCISPLHTHDGTGIIHTESASPEPNRLGQFFTEWGVRLSDSCVGELLQPRADRVLRRRQALYAGPARDRTDRPQGDRDRDRNPTRRDPEDGGFFEGIDVRRYLRRWQALSEHSLVPMRERHE